ncbi:putative bifunctional diguanylate cyclase/phosphodiesterase [Psychromonas aquatilis]|uniref:EAL domain-containing protein n=1 Tax=Psychromonas aquatilis TaxID=2005072 RepID=A0ABU9GR88_9GAMM
MTLQIEQLQTAVWIYDIDHHVILEANHAALNLWNSPSYEELFSRNFESEQSEAVKENMQQFKHAFLKNEVLYKVWEFRPKNQIKVALCQISGVYLNDGRLAMQVEASQIPPESNFQHQGTTIISLSAFSGELISSNPPFTKTFGNEFNQLANLFCEIDCFKNLIYVLSKHSTYETEAILHTEKGKKWFKVIANVVNRSNQEAHILLNYHDIHDSKMNAKKRYLPICEDSLTGLINRQGLSDRLKNLFIHEKPFAMLYIDLDGFTLINDSLGHSQGDNILLDVALRLKAIHPNNIVCRCSGDEFIYIIESKLSKSDVSQACQKILDVLSLPYKNPYGRDISVSASIGIASYPIHSCNFESLVSASDTAMRQAKKSGKKQWIYFQPEMEDAKKRLSLLSQKLSFAIKNKELSLHYQPIVDVSTPQHKMVSLEALLRWNNPELGFISPEEAIKVAEQTGLIYEIENWVLQQAIHDLVRFKQHFHEDLTMAVNLSALHIINQKTVQPILNMLAEKSLQPTDLIIELTESVLLTGLHKQENSIQPLIDSDIKLHIDDFGTGYSSLAYLHQLPASTVKVDKAFLNYIEANTTTLEYIQKLISTLSMRALIEGIETKQQAETLKGIGYTLQQGYYHGKPKPIEYYL